MIRTCAYQIQPGDVFHKGARVFTVLNSTEVLNPELCPESWADHHKRGAYLLQVTEEGREGTFDVTMPSMIPYGSGVEFLATEEDEGHYPRCSSCNEPWPCSHNEMLFRAKRVTEAAIGRAQREFEKPFPCFWCDRFTQHDSRFKTERGLKQHIARCSSNPNTWDFEQWIPTFNQHLRISGGFRPSGYESMAGFLGSSLGSAFGLDRALTVDEYLTIANEIRVRAIDGTLPNGENAASLLITEILQ